MVRKHELREMFNAIKKRFAEEEKALKAKESKEVTHEYLLKAIESINSYFENNAESQFIVQVVSKTGNTSAANSAIQHIKSLKDKAALFMAVDPESSKITHMCVVSPVSLQV